MMSLKTRASVRCVWVLVAALCAGCTGGRVTKDGSPVPADVQIHTCESTGAFLTTADSGGIFTFNPFPPNSMSNYIPEGPIAIVTLGPGEIGFSITLRNHQYDSTCPIEYNGSVQNVPCTMHYISMVDTTVTELYDEFDVFYERDCGLASELARRLSTAAIGRLTSLPITTEPSQVGCLSQCADSCIQRGIPVAEYAPCMCICVESMCGALFGPFCTEHTPSGER